MKTIKQAMTVVTMGVLLGASAWADTTNAGNLYVTGFVDAAGLGEQAGTNTVGAVNSIFIGPDAGYNATGAFNSAVFGAFSTIPPGAQYQFVYGALLTNSAASFSHLFGHQHTNYVAFTKDGAFFYVPIKLVTFNGGTVDFGGATVAGLGYGQLSGQVPASAMPAGGAWNAGNMTISNAVIQGNSLAVNNSATFNGDLTVTNGTLRGPSGQIILQVNGTDVAVGSLATVLTYGTAVGQGTTASNEAVAVGHAALATENSTALGRCAKAYGGEAIGFNAQISGGSVGVGSYNAASDCSVAVGIAGSGATFGSAVGGWGLANGYGSFAGGAFTKARGYGSVALGGDMEWWGGAPAAVASGYHDAIQLGRNRVLISTNMALAASHYLRVWGGVADGGMELSGQSGTLRVSNLTVQGAVALQPQGDISMGSFTNSPSQ
jgi:hypothetical protein